MRCRVYRSLDAPSSLFGMKGSYLVGFVAGLGAVLMLSVLAGSLTSSIVGTMLFIAGSVGDYMAVILLQSRYSEKELRKYISSLRLPRFIRVLPVKYRYLWNRQ